MAMLLALLLLPGATGAALSPASGRTQGYVRPGFLMDTAPSFRPIHGDTLLPALSVFMEAAQERQMPALVGDMVLHPLGFAFQVPEGFAYSPKSQSRSLLLVEDGKKSGAFMSSISLVITGADAHLAAMTEASVKELYKGTFSRFALIGMERRAFAQGEVLLLSFYTGASPRLFSRQCIFERDGHSYILTLTAEDHVRTLRDALASFEALCASLTFRDGKPMEVGS